MCAYIIINWAWANIVRPYGIICVIRKTGTRFIITLILHSQLFISMIPHSKMRAQVTPFRILRFLSPSAGDTAERTRSAVTIVLYILHNGSQICLHDFNSLTAFVTIRR